MIRNATKKTVLARKYKLCTNFFTRGIGLMFAKKCTPTILAFRKETLQGIHTFFVRHHLDVLFLNDQWAVVDLVKGLPSNTTYSQKRKAMFILELPDGTIARTRTTIGDVINFK